MSDSSTSALSAKQGKLIDTRLKALESNKTTVDSKITSLQNNISDLEAADTELSDKIATQENRNVIDEFYYGTDYLAKDDVWDYCKRKNKSWASGVYQSGITYFGKPGSKDISYGVELHDSSTTRLLGIIPIPKYTPPTELNVDYSLRAGRYYENGTIEGSGDMKATESTASFIFTIYTKQTITKAILNAYPYDYSTATVYYGQGKEIDITTELNSAITTGLDANYVTVDIPISKFSELTVDSNYQYECDITYEGDEYPINIYCNTSGKSVIRMYESGTGVACFTGDTLVQTETGLKQIKNIKRYEKVLSANIEQRTTEYKPVIEIQSHEPKEIYKITLEDETILNVTYSHPLIVVNKGDTYVFELEVGDILVTKDNEQIKVKEIEIIENKTRVYDIKVADNYTYFVTEKGIGVFSERNIRFDKEKIKKGVEK